MKYIELKDLTPGDDIILAWKDDITQRYYPFNAKVKKGKQIVFEDLTKSDEIMLYIEFFHIIKGFDSNNNIIIEIGVFDTIEECIKWCNFENKIMSNKYYEEDEEL